MLNGRCLGVILTVVHERGRVEERGAAYARLGQRGQLFLVLAMGCMLLSHGGQRGVHQAMTLVSITVAREVIWQSRSEIVQHQRLLL